MAEGIQPLLKKVKLFTYGLITIGVRFFFFFFLEIDGISISYFLLCSL